MTIRVGINGFGRMGRALMRIAAGRPTTLEVVAVNDLGTPEQLARLLARDSIYGRFPEPVRVDGMDLMVGTKRVCAS